MAVKCPHCERAKQRRMERYQTDPAYREHVRTKRQQSYVRHGEHKRGKAYERMVLNGTIKNPNPQLLERYGIKWPLDPSRDLGESPAAGEYQTSTL
jgi:glutaredoxin